METTKHAGGRPPKFKTPEELESKAEEYFKWCDANPIRIYKRKDAGANQTAKSGSGVKSQEGEAFANRPYTLDGLSLWCGIAAWKDFRAYHQNDEFSAVITALETRVRDQQVSGAMVGVYNSNLTARLNGIADTQNVNANIPVRIVEDGLDD